MNLNNRRTNFFPLAQVASGLATGVLLGQTTTLPAMMFGFAVLCTLGTLTLIIWKRGRLATLFLLLAFVFSGATLTMLEARKAGPNRVKRLLEDGVLTSGQPVEITGVLQRNPEVGRESLYLTLRVERIRLGGDERHTEGLVTLSAHLSQGSEQLHNLQLRYGARIRVMTALERTDSFRNPGVSPFTEYLDRKGYDASGFIKSLRLIERLEDDWVVLPLAWAYDWRDQLQKQFDSRFGAETSGVLDAALLGNRYNLSHSAEERFRDGGTFHVLVISGLHITFLGGLVFVITRRLKRSKTTQFVASVTIVWIYSLAVGAEPSILRAALMFSVVMLAPLLARRASPLNGLGVVALALLIWKPSSLFDPSFQLTFVSVLAILVLALPLLTSLSDIGTWRPTRETPYPPACSNWVRCFAESLFWNEREGARELLRANYQYTLLKSPAAKKLQRLHLQRVMRFAFAAIVVSISVQVALLPFLIIYFHRFSLASVVLNIFVGVGMAALALMALAAVAVSQVSIALSEPLIIGANGLNWLMVHSVDPFASAHIASIRLAEYTGWASSLYALYYAPLVIVAVCLSKWAPLNLPAARDGAVARRIVCLGIGSQLLAISLLMVHPFSATDNEGKLRIDFLDVDQGDSALVTLPDNTTILVDGGGKPGPFKRRGDSELENPPRESRSIGESVVSEYLWWRGLKRVDYLVATHADADHIDGLNDVVRNFNVRAVLVARSPTNDPEFAKLSQTLASRNVPVRLVGGGDTLRLGDVVIDVLWPMPSRNPNAASGNNESMVLRVRFGKRSVLLLGDIESNAERALVEQQRSRLLSDVTKVAHHGSRTSSTEAFVNATRSKLAVISVGQSSVFGHPHPEVVHRWELSGAQVVTTGNRGMITLTTDGRDMHFNTFVNP